jgi:hypothetical protein
MTIGVVTVAVGDTYLDRLQTWATAVAQLNRQPEIVTVVTNRMPRRYVEILDDLLPQWQLVTTERTWKHHPQVLVNDAIAMTDTDWICKMDADDVILPHAFDTIDDLTSTDVLMFGIRTEGKDLTFRDITAEHILKIEHNLVFSGSPFRKWLWSDNHFRDMIFEDWAFWIGCAKQTTRFTHTGTIDYVYTTHDEQISTRADTAYWTAIVEGTR